MRATKLKAIVLITLIIGSQCFPRTEEVLNQLFTVGQTYNGTGEAICLGTGPTINNCTTRIISGDRESLINSSCINYIWIHGKTCSLDIKPEGVKNVTYVGELVVWDKNETTGMIKVANYAPVNENYTVVESFPAFVVSAANSSDLPLLQEDITNQVLGALAKPWAAILGVVGIVIGVVGIGASSAIAYSAVTTAETVSWDLTELALDLDTYIMATDVRLRKIESQIALLTMVNTGRCPRYPCCVMVGDATKYKNHSEYYKAKSENITKTVNRIKKIKEGVELVQNTISSWWDSIWGWGWKTVMIAAIIAVLISLTVKLLLQLLKVDKYERLRE